MTQRRRYILLSTLVILVCYFGYNYVYKDHRDISAEVSEIEIAAPYLLERFQNNDADKLLNKTITVRGVVTASGPLSITIDSKVDCSFENEIEKIEEGMSVIIKGRCIGFDDLFGIVKLDQSSIVK